jgi:hypothetical protein
VPGDGTVVDGAPGAGASVLGGAGVVGAPGGVGASFPGGFAGTSPIGGDGCADTVVA